MKRPWPVTVMSVMAGLSALQGVAGLFKNGYGWILGFVMVLINIAMAYGLWRLRNWARVLSVILLAIVVIFFAGFLTAPTQVAKILGFDFGPALSAAALLITLAVCGLALWYLSKDSTKAVFIDGQAIEELQRRETVKPLEKVSITLDVLLVLCVGCMLASSLLHHSFGGPEFIMTGCLLIIGIVFFARKSWCDPLISALAGISLVISGIWPATPPTWWWWLCGGVMIFFAVLTVVVSAKQRSELRSLQETGLYPAPGSGTDADVRQLIQAGQPIYALRLYREIHGVDLRTAKEAVEDFKKS